MSAVQSPSAEFTSTVGVVMEELSNKAYKAVSAVEIIRGWPEAPPVGLNLTVTVAIVLAAT